MWLSSIEHFHGSFDWVLKRQDSRKERGDGGWGGGEGRCQGVFEGRGWEEEEKGSGESKSRLFHVRYEI